ncbi:MAG: ATP-dependent DNA helicase [Candidatus Gracilibacteria bacterium]|nr:ATP-dependent DNA helicase [Candidatus Gracilibacteria bacterium]
MLENLFLTEYNKLNDAQKQAVDAIYGPVMVVAGPGTGKTQIIAFRTANIIKQTGVNPENILITTFTDAGVIAIRKRLVNFLGHDGYKVKVSTFHAFSSEVISDFPEKFLEERAKQTIDDIESYEIISDILDKLISEQKVKELFTTVDRYAYLRDIKDRISKLKTEGISPNDFDKIIDSQEQEYNNKLLELENNKRIRDLEKRREKDKKVYDTHINKLIELNLIYEQYNKQIRERGFYDFADMINFVTAKFETDDEILAYYAEKFQFIMIDEFQDTNNSQNRVIDLILDYYPEEQNIMVVGDDDQSIYRFQGANIENMLDFASKYPDTKHIVMDCNYRSSQDILDLSQNLIQNNNARISNRLANISKDLTALGKNKDIKETSFFILENDIKEKLFVYEEIKKKSIEDTSPQPSPLRGEGVGQQNAPTFAIIVKTNKQIEEWSLFLQQKGFKVNSKNSSNILNNHYCTFLLDFLKFIEDPYFDDTALMNLLRSDMIDVENIDVIHIARALYQKNYSRNKFKLGLWDIIKDIENDLVFIETSKDLEKIIAFRELVLSLNATFGNSGISSLIRDVLEKLNIFDYLEENGSFDDLQDIFTLVNKIKSYIENNKNITLKNILNKFDLYKKYSLPILRESIKAIDSNIEILTAHSSKGLEYDYVFIPGAYEGNWNGKKAPDKLRLPIGIAGNGLQYADLDEKEQKDLEKEISQEEERRLFFVAMTRAKKSLIFTLPGAKDNKLLLQSSFVLEIGIEGKNVDIDVSEEELKSILINSMLDTHLINTNDDELNYIQKFLENYKLSATDLNKFIEDPKKFLREVIFRYPFLSNENLIFGTAYHKVLEVLTIEKKKDHIINLENIKEMFIQEIKKYDLTYEEFERLLERGTNSLQGYYEIFVQNTRNVIATEYNFRSKNIVFEEIPLTGKIDKIELIGVKTNYDSEPSSEGHNIQSAMFIDNVALVDYKTGSVKSTGTIKGTDKYGNKKPLEGGYFRQLLFYKLMFENCNELNSKFNIGELALDFVEGKKGDFAYVSVDYTPEEYEEFKQELRDAWNKINDIEYWKGVLAK